MLGAGQLARELHLAREEQFAREERKFYSSNRGWLREYEGNRGGGQNGWECIGNLWIPSVQRVTPVYRHLISFWVACQMAIVESLALPETMLGFGMLPKRSPKLPFLEGTQRFVVPRVMSLFGPNKRL